MQLFLTAFARRRSLSRHFRRNFVETLLIAFQAVVCSADYYSEMADRTSNLQLFMVQPRCLSAQSTKIAQQPLAYIPHHATFTHDFRVLSGRVLISLEPARV